MKKDLMYCTKNAWGEYSQKESEKVTKYAADYAAYLDISKTERKSVDNMIKLAMKQGFTAKGKKKFYIVNRDKNVAIVNMGTKSPVSGIRFVGSHVDVPRIDIKQNPLYEKEGFAQLKTHYYGGIKKYHWLSRALAIHGVILTADGRKVELSIGDKPGDPVFVISDLLPHLSGGQYKKTLSEAFDGNKLNLIIGSIPLNKEEKDAVKKNIMQILNAQYKFVEEDFMSAELEIVPAGKSHDVGFDRSLLGGYGHDDRVCAFTSATALFDADIDTPSVALLYDKEEIGSDGNTGAKSRFLEDIVIEILRKAGVKPEYVTIRETLKNSSFLSSDVSAGINPEHPEVHEAQNAAKIGNGVVITKFTGSRGKSSANDANAEFVYKIRKVFNDAKVIWQTAELGAVDVGGGGTIAKYIAEYSMDVIDCGPALLGMHSPFEIVSKADLYETYKAYKAFYQSL